ncbi:LLM class flavin-dependent oxidoreductase [Streptomyces oceani]|uniref:Methylene-tetrahydromethanopterin reductase n=1 Tax=Streptomyces oceani TaxID=1075402 RepID=A0A1E7KIT9_9ACTN|nr:LLM class flavin-dependent oxidoreductase [Streptomyces oceani]OEV03859.1 methylene-tetrahydromethanopterin reductase [Streptomyces oceani]
MHAQRPPDTRFSVLDRSLVRDGERPDAALRETVAFARQAEALGYHRFWVSEHHGVPGVAGSAPTVLAAAVASATSRIRVGTGGVMLPNHAPLVVAEQFGVLEALYPGRVDMGLGRSVGFTDGVRRALRTDKSAAEGFAAQLKELLGYFEGGGQARAVPAEGLRATPFVLATGSGADVAAAHGLPLVIGAPRSEERMRAAVESYRAGFRPSRHAGRPYLVIAVSAAAAGTAERAEPLQTSEAWSTVVSRTRGVFVPLLPPDEVRSQRMTPRESRYYAEARETQTRGTADEVAERLRALVERTGADEVLLSLNAYDRAEQLASYQLLAGQLGLMPREPVV